MNCLSPTIMFSQEQYLVIRLLISFCSKLQLYLKQLHNTEQNSFLKQLQSVVFG